MLQRPDQTRRTKALVVTAPLRYGGGSANMNSSAFNKHCAFRQVSASNPPQRKAAKRYMQGAGQTSEKKQPADKPQTSLKIKIGRLRTFSRTVFAFHYFSTGTKEFKIFPTARLTDRP